MIEPSDEFKHIVEVMLDLKVQVAELERQRRSLASDVQRLQRERDEWKARAEALGAAP